MHAAPVRNASGRRGNESASASMAIPHGENLSAAHCWIQPVWLWFHWGVERHPGLA